MKCTSLYWCRCGIGEKPCPLACCERDIFKIYDAEQVDMQTSHFYNLLAKIIIKTGFDYENDPELTESERSAVRQGLRDLKFFSPSISEAWSGSTTKSSGSPERVPESDNGAKTRNRGGAKRSA